jgi:PEP-CTERM motif
MNKILKLSVASALALGYATAHAQISQPSSGSSDLVLFAEIINSSGSVVASYAGDTGISINSVLPTASLNPSGSTVPSTGFTNISLGSIDVPANANMTSFLALDASGDSVEWAIEGGQYTGSASAANFGGVGNAKFVTTAPGGVSTITAKNVGNLTHWANIDGAITTVNANIAAAGGTTSVEGTSASGAGVWDATATGATVANWYSNGPVTYPGTVTNELGASQTLYGVTGDGNTTTVGKLQVYTLGTLTLNADGSLTSVPVPAALWLFGSGLLGLAGVGRRKAA